MCLSLYLLLNLYPILIMIFTTVLCLFLTHDHALDVTVLLPYRYRTQGTPLPKRDSPLLKKDAVLKRPITSFN
jgi:hypothetical protein